MTGHPEGGPARWWARDRRVADALSAYLDAPGEGTRAALNRLAPGEGAWLEALGDALRAFPRSAWHQVVLDAGEVGASPPCRRVTRWHTEPGGRHLRRRPAPPPEPQPMH